nr:IucA/IucC family protein [Sinobaca sp. H24]
MSSTTVGHLIKEYQHTLLADCHLLARPVTAETIANMDYSELEGEMSGHPWITYNKGRIGFNHEDYLQYAPEQKQNIRLHWIAVQSDLAHVQQLEHIHTSSFLEEECGSANGRNSSISLRPMN